jgi:hypothetical protein
MISVVLTKNQEERLEHWHVNKLRLLLLGAAPGLTNLAVRTCCNIPSVHCELLKARIRFWQTLARTPQHHIALVAALGGDLLASKQQLNGNKPSDFANPWLKQMWCYLQFAGLYDSNLADDLQHLGWKGLPNSSSFLKFQTNKLPNFSTPCDPGNRTASAEFVTCDCGQICHGSAGLAMHAFMRHHVQPPIFKCVCSNVCPCCNSVFSTKRHARLHLLRAFPRPCPERKSFNPRHFPLLKPKQYNCLTCQLHFNTWPAQQHHLAQHVEQLRSFHLLQHSEP